MSFQLREEAVDPESMRMIPIRAGSDEPPQPVQAVEGDYTRPPTLQKVPIR
jgi:hypothetical protein